MIEYPCDFLKANDVQNYKNIKLSKLSPIKIGGVAHFLFYPNNKEEMMSLVKIAEEHKIKNKILGRMSNVLFSDDYYEGAIIKTDRITSVSVKGALVEVDSGFSLPQLANLCADMGLSGLEELSGIPGSLGGAIVGNAGAFGREISELIYDVTVYDFDLKQIVTITSSKLKFSYRHSIFKEEGYIILSLRLLLVKADSNAIQENIFRYKKIRRETQPLGEPSLGSTFKRPEKNISAAKLIDECGLKGYSIGGAMVSKKHAGFIVNSGGATATDYIRLSEYITDRVYQKYGITLEREVEIIK